MAMEWLLGFCGGMRADLFFSKLMYFCNCVNEFDYVYICVFELFYMCVFGLWYPYICASLHVVYGYICVFENLCNRVLEYFSQSLYSMICIFVLDRIFNLVSVMSSNI